MDAGDNRRYRPRIVRRLKNVCAGRGSSSNIRVLRYGGLRLVIFTNHTHLDNFLLPDFDEKTFYTLLKRLNMNVNYLITGGYSVS